MEESLSSKHGGELFSNSLKHFLDSSRVSDKGNSHLQSLWWDIANWWLNVVGNPFNEIGRVFILHIQHLFVDFLGWHSSSEQGGSG
jgi:hypothetical protein